MENHSKIYLYKNLNQNKNNITVMVERTGFSVKNQITLMTRNINASTDEIANIN